VLLAGNISPHNGRRFDVFGDDVLGWDAAFALLLLLRIVYEDTSTKISNENPVFF
jgi:hypothetical protein